MKRDNFSAQLKPRLNKIRMESCRKEKRFKRVVWVQGQVQFLGEMGSDKFSYEAVREFIE